MAQSGTFSRRSFLATTAGAALAGTVSFEHPARAAAQKTLRISAGEADGPKGTMDPALSTADPDSARVSLALERLVVLDETFTPRPQLAKSWESNATADVWTFHLHSGVKFHDGAPFTAKDVLYSYKRLFDPAIASPAASSLSAIDPSGIEAVDDLTVRLKLRSAVVEFPALIANRFTYILREGQAADQIRTQAIGTGPFKVSHFVPGEEPSVFVKNEHYWRPGLPKVDVVELRSIPDPAARIAAIASGQIDLVWDLPRIGLDKLEKDPAVKVVSVRTPFVLDLAMWTDTPPFDDVRVRQALKYVVDRDKVKKLVLGGHGHVGDDNPVAPWVRYAMNEQPRKRDIAKAKALLAEAGHPNGLELELFTSNVTPGFIELATVYQALAAEAGINIKITRTPESEYWDNIWLKKPFICSSWSGRNADDALSVAYLSDAKWNETHWKRPEFDKLIADARQTVDAAKRGDLYKKAQKLLRDDGGAIIPVFPNSIGATRANISGWTLGPQQYSKDFSTVSIAG
jgi:peptide/nickel transport system substrate-binding protein